MVELIELLFYGFTSLTVLAFPIYIFVQKFRAPASIEADPLLLIGTLREEFEEAEQYLERLESALSKIDVDAYRIAVHQLNQREAELRSRIANTSGLEYQLFSDELIRLAEERDTLQSLEAVLYEAMRLKSTLQTAHSSTDFTTIRAMDWREVERILSSIDEDAHEPVALAHR